MVRGQVIKKRKISVSAVILSLFLLFASGLVLAEERSIFVGDIIEIKIITSDFDSDKIREKFKDFEIVSLVEEDYGYRVSIRTFETGEKKILLGDKEIIINVKSTLEEIEREGIFEGSLNPEKPRFNIEWRYIFYLLLIISFLSGGITLWGYINNRRKSSISPYGRFLTQAEDISENDNSYFVRLTLCFKEFLESICSCRIRGKTTSEIVNEINGIPTLQAYIPDIKEWMEESDSIKFSGTVVSNERKEALYKNLKELVTKIWENTAADAK